MRKFKLVQNAHEYDSSRVDGEILDETDIPWTKTKKPNFEWDENENVLNAVADYPEDWEEVFEPKRRFKYVGTQKQANSYGGRKPEVGKVYDSNEIIGLSQEVVYWATPYNEEDEVAKEWEEVFEQPRRFKFVGTQEEAQEYCGEDSRGRPVLGQVYDEFKVFSRLEVLEWAEHKDVKHEWQEVFEQKIPYTFGSLSLDGDTIRFVAASDIDFTPQDLVNKPAHYNQGKIQCWDAIESATVNKNGTEAYYVGNIIKYLWRYENKGGVTDIEKAKVYLDKLLELKKS